jgi:hypothetical protein
MLTIVKNLGGQIEGAPQLPTIKFSAEYTQNGGVLTPVPANDFGGKGFTTPYDIAASSASDFSLTPLASITELKVV